MSIAGRQKALETTLAGLNKRYGEGVVMKLGEATRLQVATIPTGSLSLDIALGVGGVPRGRIVEIYGPESSGKTTLCLHIIAEAQKKGGICGFIDVEHALDPAYARRIGVNVDNLYVSQPDTGEQALEIADALIRSGAIEVVVIDSVAALVPRAELEGDMGDSHVGLQARLMSQALRKLTGAVKSSGACMIFTNQLRQKIGVMFGNPETTTGGLALKFYASVRLDVRRIESIKQGNSCKVGFGLAQSLEVVAGLLGFVVTQIVNGNRIAQDFPRRMFKALGETAQDGAERRHEKRWAQRKEACEREPGLQSTGRPWRQPQPNPTHDEYNRR